MDRQWFVYECPPIDWWTGTATVEQYLRWLIATATAPDGEAEDRDEIIAFVEEFEDAVDAVATRTTWEADGEWRIASTPDPACCTMHPIFIIKQHNNGATFLACRVELPHLEEWRARPRHPREPFRGPSADRVRELGLLFFAPQLPTQ